MPRTFLLVAVPLLVLACSGEAVIEPTALTSKTAKLFLDKCNPPPPENGSTLEEVYTCLPAEDVCGEATDPTVKQALSYLIEKEGDCGKTITVYDVPCGPDLNAPQCCYAVRIKKSSNCK